MMSGYQECSVIGVPTKHPAGGGNVAGFNTYAQTGSWNQFDQWIQCDITTNSNLQNIAGIKAVFLQGIMIITNPVVGFTANLTIAFRAPGETWVTGQDYSAQAVIVGSNGIREPVGLWVPVVDNKFEMCWSRYYHPNVSYAVGLAANAYCR